MDDDWKLKALTVVKLETNMDVLRSCVKTERDNADVMSNDSSLHMSAPLETANMHLLTAVTQKDSNVTRLEEDNLTVSQAATSVTLPKNNDIQTTVGKSSFEVEIEADSNDITERPHDAHKQIHTRDAYSCTRCEKRFSNKYRLSSHMNVHSGKYKCTECGKCFRDNQMLTRHGQSHSGEKPFECTVCNKRFTRSYHLVDHGRIHSGEIREKPYKCHECDNAFSHSTHLSIHMRVHTGEKPYKCSLCDRTFRESSNLQRHKRHVHSDRRPYDCRYCGKLFKSRSEMKRHVRIHTRTKPYSCRHCSDCFTWPDQLKTHLLKSHNEGAWLICYICEKKFASSGNLKTHILRHEGVKPYVCSECQKRFFTANELKYHQRKHSDVFCCGSCGKEFNHISAVSGHFERCSGSRSFILM